MTRSRFSTAACVALLALAVACDEDESTGPSTSTVNGVQYSAQVEESVAANGRKLFLVSVTLRNTSNSAVTRRYPTGCAVQIRFYRPLDDALVYDESTRECRPTDSLSVTIPPGGSVKLSSGLRYPPTITAVIPSQEYDVTAVARTESPNVVEVRAGRYLLPFYNDG